MRVWYIQVHCVYRSAIYKTLVCFKVNNNVVGSMACTPGEVVEDQGCMEALEVDRGSDQIAPHRKLVDKCL